MAVEALAAASKTLPVSALVGTDIPQLGALLQTRPHSLNASHQALVVTRAQAKRNADEADENRRKDQQSQVTTNPVHSSPSPLHDETEPFSELHTDLFESQTSRRKMTRREKRLERQKFALVRAKDKKQNHKIPETPVDISRELQKLQDTDETLVEVRAAAESSSGPFFQESGLLYQQWQSQDLGGDEGVSQFVLPRECRHRVLQLAHSVPMSGHLGKKKTTACVAQRFYWPTMHHNIAEVCHGCVECQKCRKFRST